MMETEPLLPLEMPSFLHGTYTTAQRKALKEGRRFAEQYQKDGSFPAPRELLEVASGELVIVSKVVDFQREQPVWRLYILGEVKEEVHKVLDWKDAFHVSDVYESFCRQTAWGALYYAVSYKGVMSAGQMARRLESVLRFWDSLQAARYLSTSPTARLTLGELMSATCGWAVDAWCPEGSDSVRSGLETAAARMESATREDSIEAILRQLPRTLPFARDLKHGRVLADPALWRERLVELDARLFERLSAALPGHVLSQLYDWDKELELQ